jgi:hypothetical protein
MRKTAPKLALRKETLRTLSDLDLTRVVGGQGETAPLAGDLTHDKECPSGLALKA